MSIEQNIRTIQTQIAEAAAKVGRDASEVRLIAVSKTKPLSMVEEAVACGLTDFGENRPQELAVKHETFPDAYWHLIGQLQRNKVKHIIDKTALIHSVGSMALAEEIEKQAAKIDKVQDILIQVNVTGEESKSGVSPDSLLTLCEAISGFEHVRIKGLMTISSAFYTEEENYRAFMSLQSLFYEIKAAHIPNVFMEELSMGMTHDFCTAIAAGATMVRVGSGIFGARSYPREESNQK